MKIKKAFAWVLAVAMVITLMPSMAFAATGNAAPVISVDKNTTTNQDIIISLDDGVADTITEGSIRIKLNNAEWNATDELTTEPGVYTMVTSTLPAASLTTQAVIGMQAKSSNDGSATPASIKAKLNSDSELQLDYNFGKKMIGSTSYGAVILILPKGAIKAGEGDEDITLTIEDGKGHLNISDLKIASITGAGGKTTTTVGSAKTLARGTYDDKLAKITITEKSKNILSTGSTLEVELKLTKKGVVFTETGYWKIGGTLVSGEAITNVAINKAEEPAKAASNEAIAAKVTYLDEKTAVVSIWKNELKDNWPRELTIQPCVTIGKEATPGDVTVDVKDGDGRGNGNADPIENAYDLVIAKFAEESVAVSTVEEVPTIIAGNIETTNDKPFAVEVTLEESMVKSLTPGRYVDFKFPEEIQIAGKIKAKIGSGNAKEVIAGTDVLEIGNGLKNAGDITSTNAGIKSADASYFAFCVPSSNNTKISDGNLWKTDKANKITFEIPVTASADFTGDVTMTVSGSKAGVSETELVVAKVESPITVTTQTTEVVIGAQTQAVADITITENYPGYISDESKANTLSLSLDTLGLATGMTFQKFDSVDVTAGNLEIGKASISQNKENLNIPIKAASKEVSTIEIKGVVVALARTLPEGDYALKIGGSALVKNSDFNAGDFSKYAATYANYVNIVTPADNTPVDNNPTPTPADVSSSAKIGEGTYTLNGETVTMVGNPYVDSANRSMFPFRDLAGMCGLDRDKDVSWNNDTRTATITGYGKAVIVSIGNVTMTVIENGVPRYVTMDTEAVIKDNRTYLPARFVAEALGLTINWDQEAQTVTING